MQTKNIDKSELSVDDSQFLGVGTYGLVKRGKWRSHEVAVKYLRQPRDKPSFLRELKQLYLCNHPNIVKVFGANKEENFFVMEFADCGTLCRVVHSMPEVDYTLSHVINWAVQAGRAVAYLHSQKPRPIVHRDLKPLNLLLFQAGRVLKLCDFGTARTADSLMSNLKGTCLWMAPEVCGPKEHSGPMSKYSEKCDIYSWGIILWEMLARKRPYEADFEMRDTIKIMLHVVLENGRPRQLIGCPQELNDLINVCWAQSPEVRPSMTECVRLLEMVIPHLPQFGEPLPLSGGGSDNLRPGGASGAPFSPSVTEDPPPNTVGSAYEDEEEEEEDEQSSNMAERSSEDVAGAANRSAGNEATPEDGWEFLPHEDEWPVSASLELHAKPELQPLLALPGNMASQEIYDSHRIHLQEYVQLQNKMATLTQKKYDLDSTLRKSCSDEQEWRRVCDYLKLLLEMEALHNQSSSTEEIPVGRAAN